MSKAIEKETPLMKQYHAIKRQYPGALLLFRVGDFYETFGEDAETASKVLDIVLTKRANGAASHIALAGFPHHSLDTYLPRLVKAGYRVAICDQLEDPKATKGIVKRGVTELVTPGLSYGDQVLEIGKNNFLCAVYHINNSQKSSQQPTHGGVAFLDLSTGEFMVSEGSLEYINKLIEGYSPAEVIFSKAQRKHWGETFKNISSHTLEEWIFDKDFAENKLIHHFQTKNLQGFGIQELPSAIIAAGAILHYLELTEHRDVNHIVAIQRIDEQKYVWLDKFTIRNLELLQTPYENGTPLLAIFAKTQTPMGARLIRKWIVMPLKDVQAIKERQEVVTAFYSNKKYASVVSDALHDFGDLERLISKVAFLRANPRDVARLLHAMKQMSPIKALLEELPEDAPSYLVRIGQELDLCLSFCEKIEEMLHPTPPMALHQGGVIKEGFHAELDEWRDISKGGKTILENIRKREVERTGISSLKISYNKVFGYYLEVSNTHKDKVPDDWIRKQTLVNAERYITPELKTYEEKILAAEDKILGIETKLFEEILQIAQPYVSIIQKDARLIAILDVLHTFSVVAKERKYAPAVVDDSLDLEISKGRHPVIEMRLPEDTPYIPNDVSLNTTDQQVIIITGPNMAGKSALLRQTALIVLLAQIGSYVPASSAKIGCVDKIFTRVGASDNLSEGESTFMVEMSETAAIMNNLSSRSLVLMDEIGRGTSTFDGISIAWSIVEYMHEHPFRPKTLFATHYHELNQLSESHSRVKNFHVSVKESEGKILFMRKLKHGGSEHSFGINVAQLAGMPHWIVGRSKEIMQHFEKSRQSSERKEKVRKATDKISYQTQLFDTVDPNYQRFKLDILGIDINTMSPIEALMKLNEWQKLLKDT